MNSSNASHPRQSIEALKEKIREANKSSQLSRRKGAGFLPKSFTSTSIDHADSNNHLMLQKTLPKITKENIQTL